MAAADQFIAQSWRDRAVELAAWTMQRMVNRTDIWGRYVSRKPQDGDAKRTYQAVTAPFARERGKVFLSPSSLEKHFKARDGRGSIGVHSTSSDLTSRWFAVDVDRHDEHDLAITPEATFAAAHAWWERLQSMGFDPLLMDSNGIGGFHILVLFESPMETRSVHGFARQFVADFGRRGLDDKPEVFPGKPKWDHYGDWLRLPGRHHYRQHHTRIWNDEPWAEQKWLAGHDAIDRLLATRPVNQAAAERQGVLPARRTVCLDFDGVIHSYTSGWCGASIIPDPPIHRSREAVERLRKQFRVVVHSARCHTEEGRQAVAAWLECHEIAVDEVCAHKPPAMVYVDDRALPFRGDWDQTIADLYDFRK